MKESILSLLQTVRLIYTVSQFYNTSERTSALMVKVKYIFLLRTLRELGTLDVV